MVKGLAAFVSPFCCVLYINNAKNYVFLSWLNKNDTQKKIRTIKSFNERWEKKFSGQELVFC